MVADAADACAGVMLQSIATAEVTGLP